MDTAESWAYQIKTAAETTADLTEIVQNLTKRYNQEPR